MDTISTLHIGESGIIAQENEGKIPLKFLEMGCLPGSKVTIMEYAPLKDPIYIVVNGSHLAIRKETAEQIRILKIDE